MNIDELRIVLPHGDRASDAFIEWLKDEPRYASCLAQALHMWLTEDGGGAEDTGYDYQSWLETVIYIIVHWSIDPSQYLCLQSDKTLIEFEEIALDAGREGEWSFLNQGYYAIMSVDGKLYRRNQAIKEIK